MDKSYDFFFFFQAEDGIRDVAVTGVQTCALPISARHRRGATSRRCAARPGVGAVPAELCARHPRRLRQGLDRGERGGTGRAAGVLGRRGPRRAQTPLSPASRRKRRRLSAQPMLARGVVTMIIIGGDALALSTAHDISLIPGHRVVVLWPANPEFAAAIEAAGAVFVPGRPESPEGLAAAGVEDAISILALSGDDQLNLQAALRARDANPRIRIVLRQFNRALAAKIEQNLPNCSVLSLAWNSAATYAAAALDPSCFRGLQFPERGGPLTGFAYRTADRADIAGHTVGEAEGV